MKLSIFAFSFLGLETAQRIRNALCGAEDACQIYAPKRFAEEGVTPVFPPLPEFTGPIFQASDALIFVGASGIAVRAIAPHVKDKQTDPTVVSVDELAQFVIPLLSGHIGGANALAVRLAAALEAVAAVTTATDVNGKFSVDAWASEQGLFIDDIKSAKAVSAAILQQPVPMSSEFPIVGELPSGVIGGESGAVGFCVSWRDIRPFETTLLLVPKVVRIGIGCRRGATWSAISGLVDKIMAENHIHPEAVKSVGTIDLKKDEPGLQVFCRKRGWPVHFYPAARLEAVEGDFSPSEFVKKTTGADDVCERAAALGGGKLIVKKTSQNGVTVAVAVDKWEVRFG